MVVEHSLGVRKLEGATFPHSHDVHSVLLPQIRVPEVLTDQRGSMNVDLRDLHFLEGTNEMGEIIRETYAAGEETAHLLTGLDDVTGSGQIQDILRGITGAGTHDGKGRGGVPGSEGNVDVSNVVVGGY